MNKDKTTVVTYSKQITVTEKKLKKYFTKEGFEKLTYQEMVDSYAEHSMLEYLECHTGYNALSDMAKTKMLIKE